jgi:aminodeoxyfutalosine synthase
MLDLKNIAVSRLLLDNFPHIKAYWIMLTPPIAQVALRFGADDIDGTVVEEKIYHDAGAQTPQSLRRSQLLRLIREAGREPVERDTLYRAVTRTPAGEPRIDTTLTVNV